MTTEAELNAAFGLEVTRIVVEVTDNKALPKAERKIQQVVHAAQLSHKARLVKLADKISNLRDLTPSPPADWSLERRSDYFVWAKKVVDQIRGTHLALEALFDQESTRRPADPISNEKAAQVVIRKL